MRHCVIFKALPRILNPIHAPARFPHKPQESRSLSLSSILLFTHQNICVRVCHTAMSFSARLMLARFACTGASFFLSPLLPRRPPFFPPPAAASSAAFFF